MNQLFEWLTKAFSSWKFWIVVPPWDTGVRVRLGKNAVKLAPGPHFRVPFIDHIVLINTRQRITTIPPVTLSTENGQARCIRAVVAYRIAEPLIAILKFEWPEQTVQGFTQAAIARGGSTESVKAELEQYLSNTGVLIEYVQFTENVEAPTLRLLQGEAYIASLRFDDPGQLGQSRY